MEAQFGEIPESVMPDHEESETASYFIEREGRENRKIPFLSYGGAALIFLAVLTAFVVLKPVVMRVWPPAAIIYEMIGLPVNLPGEGVTFDRVSAKMTDEKTVLIEGQIINLTLKKQFLPPIEATLEIGGAPVARWIIAPPAPAIGPEAVLPFKARYEGDPQKAERLKLQFSLKPGAKSVWIETGARSEAIVPFGLNDQRSKTASGGGGNIPVPPADGSGRPHGGEAH